jgi:hypothetical protein
MPNIFQVLAVLVLLVLLATWIWVSRSNKKAIGVGLLLFASTAFLPFVIGTYIGEIDMDVCYSLVLDSISKSTEQAIKTNSQDALSRLVEMLKGLPTSGYETDCEKVREHVEHFGETITNGAPGP